MLKRFTRKRNQEIENRKIRAAAREATKQAKRARIAAAAAAAAEAVVEQDEILKQEKAAEEESEVDPKPSGAKRLEREDSIFGVVNVAADAPRTLELLLSNNKKWAAHKLVDDADYFRRLGKTQRPSYMWIGCSDSRVPASHVVSMPPGEIFVHRNVANLVYATDINVLSVLQFAIENLKVKHIIVCGHACCGGVLAALGPALSYPLEGWLTSLRSLKQAHSAKLDSIESNQEKLQYLCEANVRAQVATLASLPIVQAAWANNQPLSIHGLFYATPSGRLHDLGVSQSGMAVRKE